MAKEKTVYVCTNCGQESPKWAGKCPSCGQWNTFVEEVVRKEMPVAKHVAHGIESVRSKPQRLHEITSGEEQRIDMGDDELNRVLGGGLVEGSLTLIGGEPGIGKSTLVLQTVLRLTDKKVLYISGEESARQLKLRADRIPHPEANNLLIACETSLEQIFTNIKNTAPDLVIIDSDHLDGEHRLVAGQHRTSARVFSFYSEIRQRNRNTGYSDRPYQQRRQHCRTEGAGAHCRHGASVRGRPALHVPHPAEYQEPLRKYGGTGYLRNAAGRTATGEQPFGTAAYARS